MNSYKGRGMTLRFNLISKTVYLIDGNPTLQEVYSFTMDLWGDKDELTRYRFPFFSFGRYGIIVSNGWTFEVPNDFFEPITIQQMIIHDKLET